MAALNAASLQGTGSRNSQPQTLTASDTFVAQAGDVLILRNPTGGTLTANLHGSDSTSWPARGALPIDTSGGRNVSLPAGVVRVVPLEGIAAWLEGTVTVTGAAGAIATILRK